MNNQFIKEIQQFRLNSRKVRRNLQRFEGQLIEYKISIIDNVHNALRKKNGTNKTDDR